MRFPHGEGEWRTEWICRVLPGTEDAESFHKDEEGEVIHAVRIWIDVSYAAWEKYVVRGRAG